MADSGEPRIFPQLGEYLAEQHAAGYDAGPERARFRTWLGEHAEPDDADPVAGPGR